MNLVALFGSLVIIAAGGLGIVSPSRLFALIRRIQTPTGLYFAAGFRILLGVALVIAAPTSRAPEAIRLFGGIAVVAGLSTPFFGLRRYRSLLEWWSTRGPLVLRAWSTLALVLGSLLAYAVFPEVAR